MTEAGIKAHFEALAEIAIEAHRDGKKVEFQEITARGGVIYLETKISPRPPLPEEPKPSAP